MHWYANQTLIAFIAKTDRLNHFDQSFVPTFFGVKNFLAAPIVPINLENWEVVDLYFDCLWYVQLNHIRLYIWGKVLFPPPCASEQRPFLYLSLIKI